MSAMLSPKAPRITADPSLPVTRDSSFLPSAERIILALALLVVASLHILNLLNAGSLWRDEVGDIVYAAMPSGHVWSMLKYDNFPPLLLVLLHSWHGVGLGNSDFGYRIYGCLMGLCILGSLWLTARQLGARAPWVSLALFAACGSTIRYGDSIRPYGPGWLFMLLTFGLVWRVVLNPKIGRIVLAGLAALLSVQALYQNAFLLLGIGTAGMLVAARLRRWRAVLAVGGIGFVAAMSMVPYILGPIHAAQPWGIISRPGLDWSRISELLWEVTTTNNSLPPLLWLLALGVFTGVAWGTWRQATGVTGDSTGSLAREALLYAGCAAALGSGAYLVFLKLLGMCTTPWYYLLPLALIASAMDVAATVPLFTRPSWRAGRLAFLVLALAVVVPGSCNQAQTRMTNVDLFARTVAAQAAPEDFVVLSPWYYGISFHHYYRGTTPWETAPPLPDHSIHRYDLLMQQIASVDPMAPLLARMSETLRRGHRVWIVGNLAVLPDGIKLRALQPGPDPRIGWDEGRHTTFWKLQVGEFLCAHGKGVQEFVLPVQQQIFDFENVRLICVQGWQ